MSKERLTAEEMLALWVGKPYGILKAMNEFARQEVEAAIAEVTKQRDELLEACQKAFSVIVALTTDMNAPIIRDIEVAITNAQEK
jgi:hypothetical protein